MTLGGEVLDLRGLPLDGRIALVADRQHGVIGLCQLCACGLGESGVRRRVRSGRLYRLHRGVYTPGRRRLPRYGPVAAAVLAHAPGASASHRTAGWLRALRHDGRVVVDVAVRSPGRRRGGVITHSARRLRPQDISIVEGIPATSVARTLLDCAPDIGRRGTEKMVAEAERLGCFDLGAVRELLAHMAGHPGRGILRDAVVDAATAHGHTASDAEDLLLAAFRAAGLPEPECNPAIRLDDGSFAYPDFLWRSARLVVEADPRGTHDTTANYRSDRRRDRALRRVGDFETMRFSDADLRNPAACAAEAKERYEFRAATARNS